MNKSRSMKGGSNAIPKTGLMESFFSFFTPKPKDETKIKYFLKNAQPTNFKSDVFPGQLTKEGALKYNAIPREIPSTGQPSNTVPPSGGSRKSIRNTKRQKLKKRKTRRHI